VGFFVSENGETPVADCGRSSITGGTGEDVEEVKKIANEGPVKFSFGERW
jgi:hypothetical protein